MYSRFLVPKESGAISAADVLDFYLKRVKEDLGIYTGRLLWNGDGVSFKKYPMGRNMVGKIPSDMARRLHIDQANAFTFHSFRRSAATTVADAGATSDQMQDFFGWANAKMTTEYISTSKAAVKNLASKLQGREVQVSSEKASVQEPREVQEQDHTEQFSGDSKVDLWEEPDWNPTQEEMKQMKAADFLCGKPVRIQAGAKVYFINNIESLHC